jgi:hypothetical protein
MYIDATVFTNPEGPKYTDAEARPRITSRKLVLFTVPSIVIGVDDSGVSISELKDLLSTGFG